MLKRYIAFISVFFLFTDLFLLKKELSATKLINSNKSEIKKNWQKENNFINSNPYIVDSGDTLDFSIYGLSEFDTTDEVDINGNVNLPEIGNVYVSGYTLDEIKEILNKKYESVVYDPNIEILINKYRPVSFYISGEVNRPGMYSFSIDENNYVSGKFPSIYDAIILAKGINSLANLSSIEITRKNNLSSGGGYKQTTVDFLKLLLKSDQSQNIRIHNGDSIVIKRSKEILKDQILEANKTNLSPNSVIVFISGNVESKGMTQIKRGAGLVQAISQKGGTKLLSGNVEFIRFNDDGTTQRNYFRFDRNAPLNTYKNPILLDGDVINVQRTLLGNASEIIGEVSPPLFGGYGLIKLFSK